MEVNFFPSLFVCFFFLSGGGGGVEGVEALEMIFGEEGEGDFCFHSTTLFAQSPQFLPLGLTRGMSCTLTRYLA